MILIKELEERGFSKEVIEGIFDETGIYLEDDEEIEEVDRKAIHNMVSFPKAYKLDNLIIGFDDLSKLMYYVGAENENELVIKFGDLRIYEVEDDERFPVIE